MLLVMYEVVAQGQSSGYFSYLYISNAFFVVVIQTMAGLFRLLFLFHRGGTLVGSKLNATVAGASGADLHLIARRAVGRRTDRRHLVHADRGPVAGASLDAGGEHQRTR